MDRLLRVDEVCAQLALGRTRVYELIQTGELPSVQIGTARRVPESVLKQFIADRVTGSGILGAAHGVRGDTPREAVATAAV